MPSLIALCIAEWDIGTGLADVFLGLQGLGFLSFDQLPMYHVSFDNVAADITHENFVFCMSKLQAFCCMDELLSMDSSADVGSRVCNIVTNLIAPGGYAFVYVLLRCMPLYPRKTEGSRSLAFGKLSNHHTYG